MNRSRMRARQSGRLSALSAFALKYLQRAGRFPPPPFVGTPDIRPVTTTKEMKALGECMRNCAGKSSEIAGVLLGITAFYVTARRSPAGVSEPVVIELHPVKRRGTRLWIVEGVHARKRLKLPQEYVDSILQQMGDLGALVPVDPARSPETKKLMEVLGVYRWVPIGLHDLHGRMISLWLRMSPHMREYLRDRPGRVLGLSGLALAEIAFSILRLTFWASVAAIRLTLRFLIRLIAWLAGAYVGYRLVRHRARD